jgi:hypothetical protein
VLFKRQKTDWLLVTLIIGGLFLYASYRPRFRLRPDMPPDFVDQSGDASHNGGGRKIAQAYWDCLVKDIQWKYGFGRNLPGEPPVEFSLAMKDNGLVNEDSATRIRYWRRAEHLWYVRSSWKQEYEWSFGWTTDWLQGGGEWLHQRFQHLGGG